MWQGIYFSERSLVRSSSYASSHFVGKRSENRLTKLGLIGSLTCMLLVASSIELPAQRIPDPRFERELLDAIVRCQRPASNPNHVQMVEDPPGAGLRFYLVSSALHSVVQERTMQPLIEGYLNWCLSLADRRTGLWDDYSNLNPAEKKMSDADDSNAAMFFRLSVAFAKTDRGAPWWRRNRGRVIRIAQSVLLENQLPSGLVTIHSAVRLKQARDPDPGLLARTHSAYLMDNCEVYRALADLAEHMKATGEDEHERFAEAAARVALGIESLYNPRVGAFYILDTQVAAFPDFYPADEIDFYPHRAAQFYPQLFGVPLGDAQQTAEHYEAA